MKKIAIVTSKEHSVITSDDMILVNILKTSGILCVPAPWDTPETDWKTFDLVLVRSCWNYHRHIESFTAWLNILEQSSVPVFNSVDTIKWNLNKKYLRELELKGIPIPETRWLDANQLSNRDLHELLNKNNWGKAVVKPCISASAFQTMIVTTQTISDSSVDYSLTFNGGIMIQKFIEEIPAEGEISLIYFNGKFSHAVLKKAVSGEFRVQSEFGGSSEEIIPSQNMLNTSEAILSAIDKSILYARIDGVVIENQFTLMELELIEPVLFFEISPSGAATFAKFIREKL